MSRYTSKHTGSEIDAAIDRAKAGGTIDTLLAGKAPSTYLGNMSRNKIYKIGYFFKGSGASSSGAVTIRIRNFTDYGNENYMLAFLGAYGFSIEYYGQITNMYISKISVYSDTSVTGSAKKYTVFVTTQDYVDWASVYIENEHSFTRDFADVTDTFSALVDGLDKVWESEYEYLNPPMQLGVEYRTTERYMGEPVYVKLVDCGLVVDGKIIDLGLSNPAIITDAVVILQNSPGPAFFTSTGLGKYGFSYFIDYFYGTPRTCSITFHVGASLNDNPSHGYVTIKYVKRK